MDAMNDPGDEDDGAAHPRRWLHQLLAGVQFLHGPVQCFYPAEQLPPLPDHDPGDEEPRLTISRRFLEAL